MAWTDVRAKSPVFRRRKSGNATPLYLLPHACQLHRCHCACLCLFGVPQFDKYHTRLIRSTANAIYLLTGLHMYGIQCEVIYVYVLCIRRAAASSL